MGDEPESEPEVDSSKPDSAPLPASPTPTTTTTEMAIVLPRDPEGNPNPRGPDPFPSWFTPKRLLVIFCIINMLNYVDRGAIASDGVNGSSRTCTDSGICTSGSGIQGDFNLNYFEDGVLSSAFMVGVLIASPIFASLAKRLVGVGEASFISLAAPFIDDNAPVAQKTAWLSIFYMCIPIGIAVGYVYGGLVGSHLHWRAAFWGESILMLPFAILGFVIKPLQLKGFASSVSKEAKGYGEMIDKKFQDDTNERTAEQTIPVDNELADKASQKFNLILRAMASATKNKKKQLYAPISASASASARNEEALLFDSEVHLPTFSLPFSFLLLLLPLPLPHHHSKHYFRWLEYITTIH